MNPPRCIECLCWHKQDGKAWWLGYCTVTGEAVGFRTTCQLPEWQGKMKKESPGGNQGLQGKTINVMELLCRTTP